MARTTFTERVVQVDGAPIYILSFDGRTTIQPGTEYDPFKPAKDYYCGPLDALAQWKRERAQEQIHYALDYDNAHPTNEGEFAIALITHGKFSASVSTTRPGNEPWYSTAAAQIAGGNYWSIRHGQVTILDGLTPDQITEAMKPRMALFD